jgi:hypothetical protein
MRFILILLFTILLYFKPKAQDKLFFTNGTVRNGIIVSNAKETIYFKTNDTSETEKIDKSDLILVEDYKGNRYLYGSAEVEKQKDLSIDLTKNAKRNILSIQPLGVLFGRVSLQYEFLTKDLKFGFVIPFAITFNPFGTLYPASTDTNNTEPTGPGFITGLDLNYYLGRSEKKQFFIGPRIRYGTDMMLAEIKGYTVQTQFGWKLGKPSARFVQHISFGFGFLRVISVSSTQTLNPKQSYGWGSVNYRLGIRW